MNAQLRHLTVLRKKRSDHLLTLGVCASRHVQLRISFNRGDNRIRHLANPSKGNLHLADLSIANRIHRSVNLNNSDLRRRHNRSADLSNNARPRHNRLAGLSNNDPQRHHIRPVVPLINLHLEKEGDKM